LFQIWKAPAASATLVRHVVHRQSVTIDLGFNAISLINAPRSVDEADPSI
jgi:hypothetical protein